MSSISRSDMIFALYGYDSRLVKVFAQEYHRPCSVVKGIMGHHDHKKAAEEQKIRCSVLVVSDRHRGSKNTSGPVAESLLETAGHEVVYSAQVGNDPEEIRAAIETGLKKADFLLTIGGTGPSSRDRTVETVRSFLSCELPGFGELFRRKSEAEIGTAAILSRALLGVTQDKTALASLPGSEGAVRLGLEEVLLPELKHLIWDLGRYE